MNPFNEHRKSYITVCFVTAVIYAFVVGVHQPLIVRLVDGLCYGIILISTGIVALNIFRFAIPANYSTGYRVIFISALLFVTSALVTGIETFVIYLLFPSMFDSFVLTIPVRAFITVLIFVILYLFYLVFYEIIEDNRGKSEKTPMDSSQISDSEKSGTSNTVDASENKIIDRITVRTGQKIKIIPLENILFIKADGDYISIHTTEGSWLKEQTMKDTEDRLPINSFVRIHRSYIVNIHRISRIERYGEKQQVVLCNNEKIIISAARYHTLKQILGI